MQPLVIQLPGFYVAGQTVRTTNQDETRPETAKIPALWSDFFATSPATPVYGVYSNYASDAGGPFDVTAGSAAESGTSNPAAIWCSRPVAPCRRRLSQAGKPSGPTSSNTRKSNAAF